MAFHVPEEGHPDYYAMALLSDIFSNGESSRLYQCLVYDKKIAKDVISYVVNLEHPGLLWISATGMNLATADSIENEILSEIERVSTAPVTDRELEKVKNQTEASMTFGRQRANQKADLLAHYTMIRGSAALMNTEIDRFMAVTIDDLHRVARHYLLKDNRTVVHYLPK
jgi:predicted Zn-dependent peptidase